MIISEGTKILFIGDSLTDKGASTNDPDTLGMGYPRYMRDYLYSKYPELQLEVINKGISGNRSIDLINRWQSDVLNIKPDILSILIGTNDIWRQFDMPEMDIIDADMYENNLRKMVEAAIENGISKIILCEIPPIEKGFDDYNCSKALESKGNEMIAEYNKKVHKIASEFDLFLCPLNKILKDNISKGSNIKYTYDGVHPSTTGIMTYAISLINTLLL